MTTIFRYITKQLLLMTISVTLILCMIFWLARASTLLDLILNRGLDVGFFLYMSMLILPRLLIIILPIATFATVLFGYYRLTAESELVVMRAAGVSTFSLAKPGLVVGLLFAVLMATLTIYVLPASYREFKDEQHLIHDKVSSVLLQEGAFNNLAPGLTVFVRERGANQELFGIMLHDNRNPEKPQTWLAERGALFSTDAGPRVVLVNGNRQEVDRAEGQFSMLRFERTTLDIGTATGDSSKRRREPRERFLPELFKAADTRGDRFYRDNLIAEGHNRLVQPFLPLTFAAITLVFLLSGSHSRLGQATDILKAVAAAVLVLVASLGFRSLATKQPMMILAMYINALLPIAIALIFILWPPKLKPSWFVRCWRRLSGERRQAG